MAQSVGAEMEARLHVRSGYVDRGQDWANGSNLALQPGMSMELRHGLSVEFWSSWVVTDRTNTKASDDIQMIPGWSTSIAPGWDVAVGGILDYVVDGGSTAEVFGGLSFNPCRSPVTFSFEASQDVRANKDLYVSLGAEAALGDLTIEVTAGGGTKESWNTFNALSGTTCYSLGSSGGFTFELTVSLVVSNAPDEDGFKAFGGICAGWSP